MGISYQFFNFDRVDGTNLRHFGQQSKQFARELAREAHKLSSDKQFKTLFRAGKIPSTLAQRGMIRQLQKTLLESVTSTFDFHKRAADGAITTSGFTSRRKDPEIGPRAEFSNLHIDFAERTARYNTRPMRLLVKLNLIFILVFGTGIAASGYFARTFLLESARAQVLQQARLMMGSAGAMRTYTSKQVGPLLQAHQAQINTFLAQTVPAYSATEAFNYLRTDYPDYTYKEATLNPTNLRDRAVDWEADVIQTFRNHSDQKEVSGERDTPTGRSMFLAKPIVAMEPCMECHSTYRAAPAAMLKIYGRNNGFDWKVGDTVGAQIINVPMTVPLGIADRAFRTIMISLGGIALGTMFLIDLAIILMVVRPVTRLSKVADEISNGNLNMPELAVRGSDEISQLAQSFNRMYLSLVKAIRMLESS